MYVWKVLSTCMFGKHIPHVMLQMGKTSADDDTVVSQSIQESKKTYGTPARQLFNCMMKEEDETRFYELLEVFRATMKLYDQESLLNYFEGQYFAPNRIPKWAYWFRLKMFNCEWKLNTNMHVESWHNILKTHVMGRIKNVRIDKLLLILVKCEVLYFWKWSRCRLGCYLKCDPQWAVCHGHVPPESTDGPSLFTPVQIATPTATESKRKSYTDQMCGKVDTIKQLLKTRVLPVDRQKVRKGWDVYVECTFGKYFRNVYLESTFYTLAGDPCPVVSSD